MYIRKLRTYSVKFNRAQANSVFQLVFEYSILKVAKYSNILYIKLLIILLIAYSFITVIFLIKSMTCPILLVCQAFIVAFNFSKNQHVKMLMI